MASFNSLDARKATFLLAPILIACFADFNKNWGISLNCLAGRRIAPHASGSFSNLQDAEPRNSDSFALLQMLGYQTDEVIQEFASRAFRHLVFFGQSSGELVERNGNYVCHAIPLDARIGAHSWEEI
jgi:hypothetical protein